jgi:ferredoxin
VGWLSFAHTDTLIAEGYRSATEALSNWDDVLAAAGGIFPHRRVRIIVDRTLCTGCGLCAALSPNEMGIDASGHAYPRADCFQWSPADGDFVPQCPVAALSVVQRDGGRPAPSEATASSVSHGAAEIGIDDDDP